MNFINKAECNPNVFDLEAEIAKTTRLILKLSEAEESINRRMETILDKQRKICQLIDRNRDERLHNRICHLRNQIISIEQFPYRPARFRDYYYHKIEIEEARSPSLTSKELEKSVLQLDSEFRHKSKNLATERKIARKIQQFEQTAKRETDLIIPVKVDANPYYIHKLYRYRYRGWKPLPTTDVKKLIKIWAEKIQFVSGLVLRDSKNSTTPRETAELIEELIDFGRNFYLQINIGRAHFMQHWDLMKDAKNSIECVDLDLMKAKRRHERGCVKVEQLREKSREMDVIAGKMRTEMRSMRDQKSAQQRHMLRLQRRNEKKFRVENNLK